MSDGAEFDPDERAQIRKMLQDDQRARWAYSQLRIIGAWVAGLAATLVAFRADIAKLFGGG